MLSMYAVLKRVIQYFYYFFLNLNHMVCEAFYDYMLNEKFEQKMTQSLKRSHHFVF